MKGITIAFLAAYLLSAESSLAGNKSGKWNKKLSSVLDYVFREKCMGDLGCFNSGPPFFNIPERILSLLPDDRDSIGTKFFLYTPSNRDFPPMYTNGNISFWDVFHAEFNPNAKTKFIVPGFMSRYAFNWESPLKDALLKKDGSNVFLVDWTGGDGPLYEQAVANTRVVGAEIAVFINHIQQISGIKAESIHIMGHSLGSHIAGYAGKRIKNLGRITGMDPAGPYFQNVDPLVRLDRGDAILVDTIHTNASPNRFSGFGLPESIGHFDFYPNGGHIQPGCKDMGQAIWSFLQHPSFDVQSLHELMCSHSRAIQLMISSIDSKECELKGALCDTWDNYLAGKCGSCESGNATCAPMGLMAETYASYASTNHSLNFFLNTTDSAPFCFLHF